MPSSTASWRLQLRSDCGETPSSEASCGIDRPLVRNSRTASWRNSNEYGWILGINGHPSRPRTLSQQVSTVAGNSSGARSARFARLLAGDWGLWRTATGTIDKLRARLEADSGLDAEQQRVISQRLDELTARIDGERKSLRWRTRAKVGERVRWYAEPEEIE